MRVMIAEDDAASRYLLRAMLVSAGHEVEEAEDGLAALEKARVLPHDIIVTDILIPRMDGYRLLMEWKQDPALSQVPVVMLSATYTDTEDERLARDLGVEVFLTKPVDRVRLLEVLGSGTRVTPMGAEAVSSIGTREVALDRYSGRLVSKLEEKFEELSIANERLEATVRLLSDEVEVKRRLLETIARADQMKTDFLAMVSHELRTPVAGVLGYSELLARDDIDVEARSTAKRGLSRSTERLNAILNEILEALKIEADSVRMSRHEVDLGELLGAIAAGQRFDAAHDIRLVVPESAITTLGDADMLRLAVEHLVANAIKFSPDGGAITLGVRELSSGIEIWVTDEGIGIASDQLEHLFEPLVQGDMTSTRQFGGVGLGLHIVRRIIEAHEGTVQAASVPGSGSTFTVFLPVEVPEP
ncbi:MAG: ATP-binding protein [Actinomycetota bacterium]|nr:ATP-binding protein [Actinomycetota bacterium]